MPGKSLKDDRRCVPVPLTGGGGFVLSTTLVSNFCDRVWIAGSRSLNLSIRQLDHILTELAVIPVTVLHGGAHGVDASAERWANARCVPTVVFPADWDTHGRAAGPIRNRQLAAEATCLVAVLPAGPGTRSAISCARAAGIPVFEYTHVMGD